MATKKASKKKSAVKKPKTAKKKVNTKFKDPTTRVEKAILDKALKGVNVLLVASGKKPITSMPAGIPGDACNCPIAVALKPIGVTSVSGDVIKVKATTIETRVVESAFAPLAKADKPEVDKSDIEIDAYAEGLSSTVSTAIESFEEFVNQFDENELERVTREKKVQELQDQRNELDDEIDELENGW